MEGGPCTWGGGDDWRKASKVLLEQYIFLRKIALRLGGGGVGGGGWVMEDEQLQLVYTETELEKIIYDSVTICTH